MNLRLARPGDLPAIESLIAASGRDLSAGWYSPEQIESLLRHVFGADSQLVADGTYYVVEHGGRIAAAGGWSRRRTLHGGDRAGPGNDHLIDPASEPARIRAFFVHPDYARLGLGRLLFARCAEAARAAGFTSLTLVATLPGEPLYRSLGFEVVRGITLRLPDGVEVAVREMARPLGGPAS